MTSLHDRVKLVLESKQPVKLILAYVLRKMKVSHFLTIDKCLYKMRFYPSALLMHYWVDKNAREDEAVFLNRLVKLGSTVLDIGANVGTLTIPLSLHVGDRGKVISIEANPTTYRYLVGNIHYNNIKNITTYNVAVGEKEGKLYFSNISSDDMNRVLCNTTQDAIEVPVRSIDSIIYENKIKHIRLMKIDIEGYELFALKGATNALDMTDIVFFESWEEHANNYGYSTTDIIKLLIAKGFHVYKIATHKLILVNEEYRSDNCENLIAFKNTKDIDCIYEN
jgi:FkbM family methyltransferase